jgi:hypothetical protein
LSTTEICGMSNLLLSFREKFSSSEGSNISL